MPVTPKRIWKRGLGSDRDRNGDHDHNVPSASNSPSRKRCRTGVAQFPPTKKRTEVPTANRQSFYPVVSKRNAKKQAVAPLTPAPTPTTIPTSPLRGDMTRILTHLQTLPTLPPSHRLMLFFHLSLSACHLHRQPGNDISFTDFTTSAQAVQQTQPDETIFLQLRCGVCGADSSNKRKKPFMWIPLAQHFLAHNNPPPVKKRPWQENLILLRSREDVLLDCFDRTEKDADARMRLVTMLMLEGGEEWRGCIEAMENQSGYRNVPVPRFVGVRPTLGLGLETPSQAQAQVPVESRIMEVPVPKDEPSTVENVAIATVPPELPTTSRLLTVAPTELPATVQLWTTERLRTTARLPTTPPAELPTTAQLPNTAQPWTTARLRIQARLPEIYKINRKRSRSPSADVDLEELFADA